MSMRHLLEQHARYGSDAVAIRDTDMVLTYQALRDRAVRLAHALSAYGVEPGDRVAWLVDVSCHHTYELYFACCYGGFVATPMNARMSVSELRDYVAYTEPSIIFTNPAMLDHATAAAGSVPVICDGDGGPEVDYETFIAEAPDVGGLRPDEPDACVLLSPTSGTSGTTRAAMLSQNNTYRGGLSWLWPLRLRRRSKFTQGLPMYFASGSPAHFLNIFVGCEMVILPRYTPEAFTELIERHQITHVFSGPVMLYQLLDAGIDLSRLSSLEMLGAGGAVFDESRLRALIDGLGPKLFPLYGLTESAGTATILLPEDYLDDDGHVNARGTSAGKPHPGTELDVCRPDGSQVAHDGQETGAMRLTSESVGSGYWRLPDQSAEVFSDGTVETGDVGVVDQDGFLHIVDRAKDIIVSGGINVPSVEVERRIGNHPEVAQVAVIGIPDPQWGEAVHAVVVRTPGSQVTEQQVIEWTKESLAGYKKPRSVEFVDQLPMNSNGKVLKRELRSKHWPQGTRQVG